MKQGLILAVAAVLASVPGFSTTFRLSLLPANVIGGSGSYAGTWNTGQFNATWVLNDQSGPVSETSQVNQYWLNPDNGPVNAYIVIDLGAAYRIDSLELFNTHNAYINDRGTGDFNFTAGNSVVDLGLSGFDLIGPTVTLVSGTLTGIKYADDPIDSQAFTVSDTDAYRYLRFNPTSVAVGGAPCCGANVYGLNEVRVFVNDPSVTPEPATITALGLGLGSLVVLRRRSRTRKS